MYRYDEYDQRLVDERVAQFRDQTRRFLAGELSEEEFRPLRLMNGLYIQRHAPMLRVAIPYGLLDARQVRMLAHIARTWDRGYGHITTRQNIQYNWPRIEDVPDILAALASVQMHAIQTSGNCIRNITSDHLAGVSADEIEDPRPWCEIIRQWSTLHPEFSYLPRKFKIAVTGAPADRAASQVHDIGLHIVPGLDGGTGFEVLVGGGLGRAPAIGRVIREYLPKRDLLSYLEAILRVYNRLGRRDNIHKARIKVLVKQLGVEEFRRRVEAEWQAMDRAALTLGDGEIERMQAHFAPPAYRPADPLAADALERRRAAHGGFAAWLGHNTAAHKVPGYRAVFVSLKAPGVAPGDITADQLDALADIAERFSVGQVRATHTQNLLLADVHESDLFALWQGLKAHDLATANIGTLNDMIACPGLDFCSLANAGSIEVAAQINARFADLDYLYDLGEIRLNMSGCMNACGHHHVGHIGILGVDKGGEEWYQVQIGGSSSENTALGKVLGPSVPKAQVAETLAGVLETYLRHREEGERFIDTVQRIGVAPFREQVYARAA